jgi:hypothetical protein
MLNLLKSLVPRRDSNTGRGDWEWEKGKKYKTLQVANVNSKVYQFWQWKSVPPLP